MVPEVLARQKKLSEHIKSRFSENRIFEEDAMGEPVLWARDGKDLLILINHFRDDTRVEMNVLSDLTAYDNVDRRDGEKRFVVVYQLYSMTHHNRARLKLNVDEKEQVPSVCRIWRSADWLEREVYDMFGIRFKNHPDLRRIMMDERFQGFPLRKEYDIRDRHEFIDALPARLK